MKRTTTITLDAASVNLLRDALAYCELAGGWEPGEGFDSEDMDELPGLLARLNAAARRLES